MRKRKSSTPSEAARSLSKLGASKGGRARAGTLSPAKRSEIARRAAKARWDLPKAVASGPLELGDEVIDCAVVETEDGPVRLLSQAGFLRALSIRTGGRLTKSAKRTADGGAPLPLFVAHSAIKPFVGAELMEVLRSPVKYIPERGGRPAHGVPAETIPQVCDVWLKARDAGVLNEHQEKTARAADAIMRGLAQIGIVGLVDEATGYQYVRERRSLAKILEDYIAKELAAWVKTFPDEYYSEIYRLRDWPTPTGQGRTPLLGKITQDIVYDRLAPGVSEELLRVTPRDAKGRLRHHLHRKLTRNHGYQKLVAHLDVVVALMSVSRDWDDFSAKLDHAKPKPKVAEAEPALARSKQPKPGQLSLF